MNETVLIVGLGNPGVQYESNRHNVGVHCLERLATIHGFKLDRRKKRARITKGTLCGRDVVLAIPRTFMNESGRAVAPLARFYRVAIENLLVVYDDLDLPLGAIRLRPQGGSGGHNGMRSIIQQLGSQEFVRLRIGIGRPPGKMDPADYVLQDFSVEEKLDIEETLGRAVAAIETWLTEGIEEAMGRYNHQAPAS